MASRFTLDENGDLCKVLDVEQVRFYAQRCVLRPSGFAHTVTARKVKVVKRAFKTGVVADWSWLRSRK